MRYTTHLNNVKIMEWGLNLQEAVIFSWLYEAQSWAKNCVIENNVYYHASRHLAIQELPMVTEKPDTMYRYYKSLCEKGLIDVQKISGSDYVRVTRKGVDWNFFGNKSENSEENPKKLGRKSEKNSEDFPTNNNISIYQKTSKKEDSDFSEKYLQVINTILKKNFRGGNKLRRSLKVLEKAGYCMDDFKKAIFAAAQNKYHKETKLIYLTADFFTRQDKLEMYLNAFEALAVHEKEEYARLDKQITPVELDEDGNPILDF